MKQHIILKTRKKEDLKINKETIHKFQPIRNKGQDESTIH